MRRSLLSLLCRRRTSSLADVPTNSQHFETKRAKLENVCNSPDINAIHQISRHQCAKCVKMQQNPTNPNQQKVSQNLWFVLRKSSIDTMIATNLVIQNNKQNAIKHRTNLKITHFVQSKDDETRAVKAHENHETSTSDQTPKSLSTNLCASLGSCPQNPASTADLPRRSRTCFQGSSARACTYGSSDEHKSRPRRAASLIRPAPLCKKHDRSHKWLPKDNESAFDNMSGARSITNVENV